MREKRKLNQARILRKNSTPAESRLWEQLRNRQLDGFKFLRQATVGPYIVDFLCREVKFIIELDGWTHSIAEEIAHDQRRSAVLAAECYRLIRFDNIEVMEGMDQLLARISEELRQVTSLGPSSPPLLRNGSPSSPARGRRQITHTE